MADSGVIVGVTDATKRRDDEEVARTNVESGAMLTEEDEGIRGEDDED